MLAFDQDRLEFVNCHVLLQPLDNRTAFEQACKTLQRDGHPLFARMLDYGEDDGNPYYITGNIDGESLNAYFQRQSELPVWLAVMLAGRALDSATALAERGDYLCENALETFRVFQTGATTLQVCAADYRVVDRPGKNKGRLVKANFERQGKFLRAFLQEKAGGGSGPTLPETLVNAMDFSELLGAVLGSGGPGLVDAMIEVRQALRKLIPDHLASEIPTTHKPRALVAPLLASYQDVARAVVNLVRIQSQRLDMSNPYAMRGTLTRAGRPVMVEQVPPPNLAGRAVLDFLQAAQKLGRRREINALLGVPMVNEIKGGISCVAEEIVEGIPLTDLLAERSSLQVNETYLVLAGLDAALAQLETSRLPTKKLRLEDILLLTGFAKDDARTARLLTAKITEWPSFRIMLRAHPTLASMTGRGTDPGELLPPPLPGAAQIWHGGWLACVARFLLGNPSESGPQREREGILNLITEELAKARDGSPTSRPDFLARYARIIQHYDLVQSVPITVIPPSQQTKSTATRPLVTQGGVAPLMQPPEPKKPEPAPQAAVVAKVSEPEPEPQKAVLPLPREPLPPLTSTPQAAPSRFEPVGPLTSPIAAALSGGAAMPVPPEGEGRPTIGFAELLFQGGSSGPPPAPVHQQVAAWGSGASAQMESGEVGGWELEAQEEIPQWLKAAVFFGGSLVAGAVLAHITGDALWEQRSPPSKTVPAPVVAPTLPAPNKPAGTLITPGVPKRPS